MQQCDTSYSYSPGNLSNRPLPNLEKTSDSLEGRILVIEGEVKKKEELHKKACDLTLRASRQVHEEHLKTNQKLNALIRLSFDIRTVVTQNLPLPSTPFDRQSETFTGSPCGDAIATLEGAIDNMPLEAMNEEGLRSISYLENELLTLQKRAFLLRMTILEKIEVERLMNATTLFETSEALNRNIDNRNRRFEPIHNALLLCRDQIRELAAEEATAEQAGLMTRIRKEISKLNAPPTGFENSFGSIDRAIREYRAGADETERLLENYSETERKKTAAFRELQRVKQDFAAVEEEKKKVDGMIAAKKRLFLSSC